MTETPASAEDCSEPEARVLARRHRLVRVVGAGGMGVVWEAVNTWTGRRVALSCAPAGAGIACGLRF